MRRFVLHRITDVSGYSGTGIVAEGAEFGDGRVVMRWTTNSAHSIVLHDSAQELIRVHGHNGATQIVWLDPQDKQTQKETDNDPGKER